MSSFPCAVCSSPLEEIGIPPAIAALSKLEVVDIGTEQVPREIKDDPFLYRGFFCSACREAFCPRCANMQGEICPRCSQRTLAPAYRGLLKKAEPDRPSAGYDPRHYEKIKALGLLAKIALYSAAGISADEHLPHDVAFKASNKLMDESVHKDLWKRQFGEDEVTDGLRLQGVDLRDLAFLQWGLGRADLRNANLDTTFWAVTDLHDADLSGVQCRGSWLSIVCDRARLHRADLTGTTFIPVTHPNNRNTVDLTGANLTDADIRLTYGRLILTDASVDGCSIFYLDSDDRALGDLQFTLSHLTDVQCAKVTWILDSSVAFRLSEDQRSKMTKLRTNQAAPPARSGNCFIATASCGSSQAPDVVTLRRFREDVLRRTALGRRAIRTYEHVSPKWARWIEGSSFRRFVARILIVRPAARMARALEILTLLRARLRA